MKISDLETIKVASPALRGPYTVTVKTVTLQTTGDDKKHLIVDCGKSSIRLTMRNANLAVVAGMPDDTDEWTGMKVKISSETDAFKNWFWRLSPCQE